MKFAPFPLTLALALLVSCGGGEKTAEALLPSGPAAVPDLANGAIVAGTVRFAGEPPAAAPLDMSANPVCAGLNPQSARSEEVLVGPGRGLRNVFVRVKSGLHPARWSVPETPVVIDQVGCIYRPHVVGVMTGQPVEFRNSDNTNHNIHLLSQVNPPWNESQPAKADPKIKRFHREEIMAPIKCNVHPWMRVYIGVSSHPFFAVTGEDGAFALRGLPPGTYAIEAWHEKYGRRETAITLGPKETKTLTFTFPS